MSDREFVSLFVIAVLLLSISSVIAAVQVSRLKDRVAELEAVPVTTAPHTCISEAPTP